MCINVCTLNLSKKCNESLSYYCNDLIKLRIFNDIDTLTKSLLSISTTMVVILDIDENTRDSINLISYLKSQNCTIVCLTNSCNKEERVRLYSLGASRVVTKPCLCEELIYAIMLSKPQIATHTISDKNFDINIKQGHVLFQDQEIALAPKLVSLLVTFIENEGKLLSRAFLSNEIYNDGTNRDRNIDTMIKQLRKSTNCNLFVCKRGYGYVYQEQALANSEYNYDAGVTKTA